MNLRAVSRLLFDATGLLPDTARGLPTLSWLFLIPARNFRPQPIAVLATVDRSKASINLVVVTGIPFEGSLNEVKSRDETAVVFRAVVGVDQVHHGVTLAGATFSSRRCSRKRRVNSARSSLSAGRSILVQSG